MLINFDFDGVIADTFDHLLNLCITAQAEIGYGRSPVAEDLRTVENLTFAGLAERLKIAPGLVPKFEELTFILQRKAVPDVRFFYGMRELLLNLDHGTDIAIITSGDAEVVRGYLRDHGVAGVVATVAGGETRRSKAASLRINMERFATTPGTTWMIGDAVSDIRQGREAGVGTIAVSWGFQARSLLENESPDYLADSPEELMTILRSL